MPTAVFSRRGKPSAPPDAEPGEAPIASARAVQGARMRTRLVRAGVVAALCAGPLALLHSCAAAHPAARSVVRAAPVRAQPDGTPAAGFAQLFVGAWLRADGDHPDDARAQLVRALGPGVDLISGGAPGVQGTAVVRSAQVRAGYWSVVVAAELPSGAVRYFQVPVVTSGAGALAVAGDPAQVAAPVQAPVPQGGDGTSVVGGSPLAQSVTAFLQAYLVGQGDVSPLLAPGVRLAAPSPAPFRQLQVGQIGADRSGIDQAVPADGTSVQVQVQVQASDAGGAQWTLQYVLRMRARAGRWEVDALDSAPAAGAGGAQ